MKMTFLCLLLAGLSTSAWAYVPPSHFLVKGMVAKKAGPKGVRVRSLVTAYDGDQPTNVRFKVTTLYEPDRNLIRSVAFDEISNAQLYIHERRADGVDQGGFPVTAVISVLFDPKSERVTRALMAQGLPIKTEQELLGYRDEDARRAAENVRIDRRIDGRKHTVAWVVGDKNAKFQLWLEKDTFYPVDLWWNPEDGRQVLMENYRTYGDYPFPRTVSLIERKKPVLKDELVDLLVNPLTLAEFKALKSSSPLTPGFTEAGNKAPGGIKDLIQLYFSTLR